MSDGSPGAATKHDSNRTLLDASQPDNPQTELAPEKTLAAPLQSDVAPLDSGRLNEDEAALCVRGEFNHLHKLAQGGLGIVYLAADARLHRKVAIKFILRRHADDTDSRDRLKLEAEITGRLEHPGVVPVYAIGETAAGRLFYVMRYINGETMAAAVRRHHENGHTQTDGHYELERRNLLTRFVSVCKTMAYAHNRGIVHRDIKPENVMLGRYGETLVVDWGLATPIDLKRDTPLSNESMLVPVNDSSKSGSRGGTPQYMSPEQAAGVVGLGPASDIYSLGSTLYEILTGRPPYDGHGVREVLDRVLVGRFTPPSRLRSDVPRDLEAVCLKAMEFDPINRYATALDLAHDVELWLADCPVSVVKESAGSKLARWGRRHRTAMRSSIAALVLFALTCAGLTLWAVNNAQQARESRDSAVGAQRESLLTAAQYAGECAAAEIDRRLRILESEAKNTEVRRLLADRSPENDRQLDVLTMALYERNRKAALCSGWALLTPDGTQIGWGGEVTRSSVGQNFARRDYYHGRGREFPAAEAQQYGPISAPHLSSAYFSSTKHKLVGAFSVPVKEHDRENEQPRTIGVLVMVIDFEELVILPKVGEQRTAVLLDLRDYSIGGESARGVILQHPHLPAQRASLEGTAVQPLFRIPPAALPKLGGDEGGRYEPVLFEYVDPLGASKTPVTAAMQPVQLTRGDRPFIPWAVIVQENSPPAVQ